jgi:hypothetical protein
MTALEIFRVGTIFAGKYAGTDMSKTRIDMSGRRYGRLIVLDFAGCTVRSNGKSHVALWRCACDCGCETIVLGTKLRSGNTRSCGCLRSLSHVPMSERTADGLAKLAPFKYQLRHPKEPRPVPPERAAMTEPLRRYADLRAANAEARRAARAADPELAARSRWTSGIKRCGCGMPLSPEGTCAPDCSIAHPWIDQLVKRHRTAEKWHEDCR